MAADLLDEGVTVAMLHPGVVETDLFRCYHARPACTQEAVPTAALQAAPKASTKNAPMTVEQSVRGLLDCIGQMCIGNTGRFWTAEDGSELEW